MKKISLAILFMLAFPVWVQAADVKAFVDRTHVGMGESINLTVTTSGSDADIDISEIRDFTVVSRGTSTSVQIVNGRMSRQVSYNYMLVPLREGRLVIPPLTAVSDGRSLQTQAIVVQVSKQTPADSGRNDLFVRSQISEQNPFEGQQIIYTFRLYTAIRLANAKFQKPEFTGFTAKEAGDTKTYQTGVNGREYTVSEISYVLVPLKPGKATIAPGTFRCDTVRSRNRRPRSFFDSFFDDPFLGQAELEPKILTTEAFTVDIRPLPAYHGDVKFSGLVGKFELQAELEKTQINVGDSTTLTLAIAGTGNIMDAVPPEVAVPDAFKVYSDNPEEHITVNESGFSGKKIFRTALVAVRPGVYTIPAVRIRYFDVSKGEYKTVSTRLFSLTANPLAEKENIKVFSAPAVQEQPALKKKRVEFTGHDILPLKEELDALISRRSMQLPRFILLLAAPVLLYLTY
ncbi:MAG: protein BatD [Desulfobacterales bacterium]|uniref:Protein BatD n=1 Tax=Candidatus Desulfatibia profunda TaxID=2841695 RepID=A0A8J6NMS6_9BACT|nr:protein BatD [Candidatus Desulfatibia profunda]MBL7181353.1 protein BatD [Desulfobacterales bacterium]